MRIAETVQAHLSQTPAADGESLVSLDTYGLRTIKTALRTDLQEALSDKTSAWVPVVNLTGLTLLKDRGFKMPVTFAVDSAVAVDFDSTLISAGINRTKYAVTMTVRSQLYSASTAFTDVVTVRSAYPVYESVLEGEVPRYAAGLVSGG